MGTKSGVSVEVKSKVMSFQTSSAAAKAGECLAAWRRIQGPQPGCRALIGGITMASIATRLVRVSRRCLVGRFGRCLTKLQDHVVAKKIQEQVHLPGVDTPEATGISTRRYQGSGPADAAPGQCGTICSE